MTRFAIPIVISLAALGLFSCVRQQSPKGPPRLQAPPSIAEKASRQQPPADEALPPDGFAPGWKATPGSYIYADSEDELWKIYDGAAPGVIAQGGREAVTQGYENQEAGADKSFRVFILRFNDQPHALAFLKKDLEGSTGGENLAACASAEGTSGASHPARAPAVPPGTAAAGPATGSVAAGQIFDKRKAPWARFVLGPFLVSLNWEGSTDDSDNATLSAIRTIAAKLRADSSGAAALPRQARSS